MLTSVHAFAADPARGMFILVFLASWSAARCCCTPGARRASALGGRFALVSRETLLLANNVLLIVAAASVLLGTLYPLVLDALGAGQDFGRAAVLRCGVRAADGAGGVPDGRRPDRALEARRLPELAVRLRWALAASGVAALLLPLALPAEQRAWSPLSTFALLLAAWAVASAVAHACSAWPVRKAAGSNAPGVSRAAGTACWWRMRVSACSSSARRWPTASKASRS